MLGLQTISVRVDCKIQTADFVGNRWSRLGTLDFTTSSTALLALLVRESIKVLIKRSKVIMRLFRDEKKPLNTALKSPSRSDRTSLQVRLSEVSKSLNRIESRFLQLGLKVAKRTAYDIVVWLERLDP